MQYLSLLATQVRTEMAKVVIGQQQVVDQLLLVLLCGGHAVIEGVPGLAKTLAVKSLARICALGFSRVQCTADLMPADVTGTNVFNLSNSTFNLHKGPIFTGPVAGGRNEPDFAAHASRASGGHGRTSGNDRWHALSAIGKFHGAGNAKSH